MRPEPFERGTLHYGIELDGKLHKEFEVGPLSVADWLAMETKRVATKEGDQVEFTHYALEVLSRRLLSLGEIPRSKITTAFLEQNLRMPDLSLLVVAVGRLDERLETFRAAYEGNPTPDDGACPADGLVT